MEVVNILGAEWKIIFRNEEEDPKLEDNDGYCDWTTHEIIICRYGKPDVMDCRNIPLAMRNTIRHEIVHAFAFESGLAQYNEWAQNEEMVDWIARQFPKMLEAFKSIDAMD